MINKKIKIFFSVLMACLVTVGITYAARTLTQFLQQNSSVVTDTTYLVSKQNFGIALEGAFSVTAATSTNGSLSTTTDSAAISRYYFKVLHTDGIGFTVPTAQVNCRLQSSNSDNGCLVSWATTTKPITTRMYYATTSLGVSDYVRYFTATTTYQYFFSTTVDGTIGTIPTETSAFVSKISTESDSWFLRTNIGMGTTTDLTAKLSIQASGTDDVLNVYEGSGNEIFTILENGNIGIASSTPNFTLDIIGELYVTGTTTVERLELIGKTGTTTCSAMVEGQIFYNTTDNQFWGCDGTNWLRLNN